MSAPQPHAARTGQTPGFPMRHAAVALLRITLLVLGLLLALVYLEVGYFLVPIVLLGAVLAAALTRAHWQSARSPLAAMGAVILTYAVVTALAWNVLLGQEIERTFTMRWESRGRDNGHRATEVVLSFVDYPGHYIGEYSDDLYAYLAARQENPVAVTFLVTRDLGWCTRGFHATQVGTLQAWKTAWGYAGSDGRAPSPWRNPWWCP